MRTHALPIRVTPGHPVMSHRWAISLIALALIGTILIGARIPLAADDYCHAAGVAAHGVLGQMQVQYTSWSGRFAQMGLTGLTFALFGTHAETASTIVLIGGLVAALAFALWRHVQQPILIAALITALYIALLDTFVWQGLYWMAGGQTYVPPVIGASLLWGMIERRTPLPLITLVGFMLAGFHETAALLIGAVLVLLLARHHLKAVAAALVGLAIGIGIVMLAPGNNVRSDLLPEAVSLTQAFVLASAGTAANIIRVLLHAPLAVVALIMMGAMLRGGEKVRLGIIGAAVLGAIGFSVLSLLPGAWMMGGNISPPRFYVISTAVICAALIVVGTGLPRLRWSHALTAIAIVALIGVGQLYVFNATALSTQGGFEQLAQLDTPQSASWVADCANEWASIGP